MCECPSAATARAAEEARKRAEAEAAVLAKRRADAAALEDLRQRQKASSDEKAKRRVEEAKVRAMHEEMSRVILPHRASRYACGDGEWGWGR
jgi:hypothetical protein